MAWVPLSNDEPQLPVLHALLACAGELERVASRHLEGLGLTAPRFDVLSALGDTDGLTVKELAEVSLTTKGTLLHVIASLEEKGLVTRCKGTGDARRTLVALTPAGQQLYEEVFFVHVDHMRPYFDCFSPEEARTVVGLLSKLRASLARGRS